ncbi:rhomboid family intramembrane serine protease [Clostridium boliviensis]|uniref:Rhomboid family intramembrane serine protease n=1 Tax=Clostridium boliviensis TaxID=318465 RepID=A0ABU4GKS3_9CLOT|nr:rhomboid family intramembrane serine protease [Clostridium boliviensis]MDW2798215.1 rhomboid family intramembrane serine protease [Clostridium boliviensis]
MKFFYNLERRFRKYAIPNLMYYIIGMYGTGLFLQLFTPGFYVQYLALDAQKILSGQVWRVVTFMIYPPGGGSLFGSLIGMYLYYMLGVNLERIWGAFRFNVYFFMGVIGHVAAALVVYIFFKQNIYLTTEFLNYSLFFAFAATFPDLEFLLFFVIPIKAKWMALFNGIYFLYEFIMGNMAIRITIVMSLINFFVFFLLTRDLNRFNPREIKRKQNFHRQMKIMPQGGTHHKCAVCGRTEKDSPNLEFRYCSKCEGSLEYCSEHLYTHKHVTSDNPTTGDTTN